jgi:hypothetical protein
MSPCHIHNKVIQRSKGHSALERLAYQSCDFFDDGFRKADYSQAAEAHRGDVILLPEGAPPRFAEMEYFLMAIIGREKRADSQEGRAIDFAIPRAVPDHLLLAVAAFVVVPFVQMGMAVRVDVECPPASDGGLNPHAHCYVAQRLLEPDGFGKKQREWNETFRRDGGRHFRALIAGRLTLACVMLGIGAHVDPRRHDETGRGDPEERLSPVLWRIHDEGGHVEAIETLKRSRRSKAKAAVRKLHPDGRSEGHVTVSSALSTRGNHVRAAAAMKQVIDWAQAAGITVERFLNEKHSHLTPVRLDGTAVVFDGVAFQMGLGGSADDAALIVTLARSLDWPALVVDGDAQLADMVIVAGAFDGLTAVNRMASPAAIALICEAQFGVFADQIARHDPPGVVAASLMEFMPPTPGHAAVPTAHEFEDPDLFPCPSAVQAQRDPVAAAQGAQIAQEYFERQHRQLDELQSFLDNRKEKRATARAIPCGPPAEGPTP